MAASFVCCGQYTSALCAYTAALSGGEGDATTYLNRALVHSKLELHRRCLKDCEAALRLDPYCLKAYLLQGGRLRGSAEARAGAAGL